MPAVEQKSQPYSIREPKNLSPRIQWLRDYYFQGVDRAWNKEYTAWTNGTPWDFQYQEASFHIVPETYAFLKTFHSCYKQTAQKVELHPDFWSWSLPERRAWFVREVMVHSAAQGSRQIPVNLSCIDFNDVEMARFIRSALARAAQPRREIGNPAATMMAVQISDHIAPPVGCSCRRMRSCTWRRAKTLQGRNSTSASWRITDHHELAEEGLEMQPLDYHGYRKAKQGQA